MWSETVQLIPSPTYWALYFFCAILIGISKTGIQNVGTLAIPIFAFLFGAKFSTGIVLILLCFADLMAVIYYRKKFLWREIKPMLLYAFIGLLIGLFLGDHINDQTFKVIMGACILLSVLLMLWMSNQSKKENSNATNFTSKWWYSPFFGLLVGFSTMIGNAAGPALSLYLISKKLNKVALVATGAWFIMILNFSKIPLQLLVWKNLTIEGFILNSLAIPFIFFGAFIGIKLVKVIPEKEFKMTILALVILASVMLMFG